MLKITSKENNKIKDLVKLRDDSTFRDNKSLFFVEGEKIINDTPYELIENIYIDNDYINEFDHIVKKNNEENIYIVTHDIYNKIKSTQNSQGIIATVKSNILTNFKNITEFNINSLLILDNILDPGNLGTIVRVAEAANIGAIILINNCCDITNPKVIRSCMSSIFRMKIYICENAIDLLSYIKSIGFKIYSAVLDDDSVLLSNCKFVDRTALVIGNESNGISKLVRDNTDIKIKIPMCGKIESLNAAIATSILCYDLMRQNNYYENK